MSRQSPKPQATRYPSGPAPSRGSSRGSRAARRPAAQAGGAASARRADTRSGRPDDLGVSKGGAAAKTAAVATTPAAASAGRDADDTSPLLTRRAWMGLAWGAFSAASAAALAATGRFMFPERAQRAAAAVQGRVPERIRHGRRRALEGEVRHLARAHAGRCPDAGASGFFALITVCTHLGCTPNYLVGRKQVQVPLPRQRLPDERRQLRRARAAAARARAHRAGRRRPDSRGSEPEIPAGAGAVDRSRGVSRVNESRIRGLDSTGTSDPSQILTRSDITVWLTPRPSPRRKARPPGSGTG